MSAFAFVDAPSPKPLIFMLTFPIPSTHPQPRQITNQERGLPPISAQISVRSKLDPRVQRELLPHHENLLLLPAPTRIHHLVIEMPEKISEEETHFQVCEIAAEAISRPDRERVEGGPRRAGFRGLVGWGEPTVRVECGGGIWEVEGGVVGGVLGAGDEGLVGLVRRLLERGMKGMRSWGVGLTPPGRKLPATLAPAGGTTRGRPGEMGGHTRRPSSMTAARYGSLLTESEDIKDALGNAWRTSWVTLFIMVGFCIKQPIMPVRAVPMVSLPATTRNRNVHSISVWLMPFSSL